MKKLSKEYTPSTIPDIDELKKALSVTNELRHQYWDNLRKVRNQIGRYKKAHTIKLLELESMMTGMSSRETKFYKQEWEAGRKIESDELDRMMERCNLLWSTSQSIEELRRKSKINKNDPFFSARTCEICSIPLTGRQQKYCSDSCKSKARSRRWREKTPDKKQKSNLKYLQSTMG